MQIKRILLLGASGQIGKELSIHLQKNNSINLTCVVRNKVSAAFFKRNNISEISSGKNMDKWIEIYKKGPKYCFTGVR